MNKYTQNLRGDVLGGVTAGIVALPLALAFGVSSGLGPSAGLYGAIFICFFASLFGGTNTQISGPTAPMTAISLVVVASILSAYDGKLELALPIILAVFLVSGLLQILLGLMKLGSYIKYIPYPVVSGFMTAIGFIIIITQMLPILGYKPKEDANLVDKYHIMAEEVLLEKILHKKAQEGTLNIEKFTHANIEANQLTEDDIIAEAKSLVGKETSQVLGSLLTLPRALMNINWLEFLLALSTIVIIYGFKRITTLVPSTLVALIVVTLVAVVFNLPYTHIAAIPSGLPQIQWGIFTHLNIAEIAPYLVMAVSLAFLGAIDSLLTSVVADNMTKTKHNSNQELIGQGIGNSIASMFGGIPGAGATIRTAVNINSGGKTKISGVTSAIFLLIILFALGPIASKIPAAVLAGILFTVGVGVMDWKGLKEIPYTPKPEVLIMIIVLILSSFWNLVFAVGIGLLMASLMFMKKVGDITGTRSYVAPIDGEKEWDADNIGEELHELKDKVVIKRIRGPLFFGSNDHIPNLSKQIPKDCPILLLCVDRMPYIDQTGVRALSEVIQNLKKNGKLVLISGLLDQPKERLTSSKVISDVIESKYVFDTVHDSLTWLKKNKDQYENN